MNEKEGGDNDELNKMKQEEHNLQVACVRWFRLQYPHLTLIAIPNGGHRNIITAGKLKAEGVMAGAPDLFLFFPRGNYHGLCIEMKTEKGRQSEVQELFQDKVEDVGYKYVICRTIDEFISEVNKYLQ